MFFIFHKQANCQFHRISRSFKIMALLSVFFMLVLTGCSDSASNSREPDFVFSPNSNTQTENNVAVGPTDVMDKPAASTDVSPDAAPEAVPDGISDLTEISEEQPSPKIIVLDPGHGGIFSGAEYDGRIEKKLTLKIAEYLQKYLLDNYSGIEVYLTRETDIELDKDIVQELENRAIFAKEHNADIFVSLHLNASNSHDTSGCTVYYSLRDNVSAEGKKLASEIKNSLTAMGISDRGVQTRPSNDTFDEAGNPYDYYAVIRHNANRDIPAVIVEHCFIDSSTDIRFIDEEDDLKRLAKADAEGIMNYLSSISKE